MAQFTGTSGDDTLTGDVENDTLLGGQGNDLLQGGDGADSLGGDFGDDSLVGGAGDDTLQGSAGNDLLQGGSGNDILQHGGQGGADTLEGGDGDDTLSANNLIINGSPVFGDFAGSVFDGGDGFDWLQVGGPVTFRGAVSNVEGLGLQPAYSITVGGTTNVVGPPTQLSMRAGAFHFTTVRGVGEIDLDVDAADDAAVDLSGLTFQPGANVTIAITGSDANDTITGTSRADDLDGEDGDDVLTGGGGADTFELSEGQDRITDFVRGTDKVDLSDYGFDGFASLQPYLSEVGGDTVLSITYGGVTHTTTFVGVTGLTATDFLFPTEAVQNEGTESADLLPGGVGDDSLAGFGGADTLAGFGGNDTLSGGQGSDLLTGGGGADSLDGGDGADTLQGGADNDTLGGGAGADLLQGEAGDDVLRSFGHEGGTDTLEGGDGNDTLSAINLTINGALAASDFAGSVYDGGDGVDYLGVGGPVTFRGALHNMEGIAFVAPFSAPPVAAGTPVLTMRASDFDASFGDGVTLRGTGQLVIEADAAVDLSGAAFEGAANVAVAVNGSAAADTIIGSSRADNLFGAAGDDTLAGRDGNDTLFGALGNDLVQGGDGADEVNDDIGDDTLEGGAGDDALDGGAGNDQLTGGDGADVFEISEGHDRITDFVKGTDKFDLSDYGFGGFPNLQPYLTEVSGDTVLTITYGGAVHTTTFVGVTGLSESDFLFATDPVDGAGTESADFIPGGFGDDLLTGLGGADTLAGFGGNDTLQGNAGDDSLDGGGGDDSLLGGLGDDLLQGGSGNDTLSGDIGADSVSAGAGGDRVETSGGGDVVSLGEGADVIAPSADFAGQVVVSDFTTGVGGDRFDLAAFLAAKASGLAGGANPFASGHLRLLQNGADTLLQFDADGGGNGFVTIATLQNTTASQFTADNFGGFAPASFDPNGPNALTGTAGADTLDGQGGNDTLMGGQGDDLLLGGDGADTLGGDLGHDTLQGGAGADTLQGSAGNDLLQGGSGNDTLQHGGQGGADTLEGGDGDDTLSANNLIIGGNPTFGDFDGSVFDGGDGFDYLQVGGPVTFRGTVTNVEGLGLQPAFSTTVGGNTTIVGPPTQLSMRAGAFHFTTVRGVGEIDLDVDAADNQPVDLSGLSFDPSANVTIAITGSDANDTITGTSRGDDLDGEDGDDVLTGGDGADTFELSEGHDRITDFVQGADKIDLSDYGFDGFASLLPYLSEVGGDTVVSITYGGVTHTTTLVGVTGLTATDLLFPTQAVENEGTESADLLPGGVGDDSLAGFGGNDTLAGFGGADTLTGNAGDDSLDGGDGPDSLLGGLGDDLLQGGSGNDTLSGDIGADSVSAGAGSDRVETSGGGDVVSLGEGADVIAPSADFAGQVVVSDFTTGVGGDRFDLAAFLAAKASGLAGGANPFASGHLRLLQNGADTLLQFDADGGGNGFVTIATLQNTTASQFTADNFGGFAPASFDPNGPNALTGTAGADTLDGQGGNDTLMGGQGDDLLLGGDGADTLGGDLGHDTLQGGAGADTLQGSAGNDLLQGGSGNDTLQHGGQGGADTLEGGDGDDTLSANNLIIGGNPTFGDFDGSVFDGGDGFDYLQVGGPVTFRGTVTNVEGLGLQPAFSTTVGGNTTVVGPPTQLSMRAGAFHFTTVRGVGEIDLDVDAADNQPVDLSGLSFDPSANVTIAITGSDANDTITGTSRGDDLDGEDGDDVLTGGGGADTFELSEGHDRITDFVKGTDKIDLSDYGFDGFASLLPNLSVVGGDTVLSIPFGGTIHTTTIVGVTGLTAADFLFPTEAVENEGTEAADLLPGGISDDLLTGLGGDDTLAGFGGNDTLQGGGGDDLLAPGAGADIVDGGAGVDRLTLAGASGVSVNLGLTGAQNTGAGAKTITNVEHLTGTSGSDTLTGNGGGNWLWGNGGAADSLNGGGGDDLLTVGAGAHTLVGGAGEDAAAFATPGGVNVSLAVVGAQTTGQGQMTLNGVERLSGSAQGDTLTGNAAANVLAGAQGADSLNGGAGDDLVLGDGAIDVAQPGMGGAIGVVNDLGQAFADTLAGGLGADTLIGGGGDDLLAGGLGNDLLNGGAGADVATYQDATGAVSVDLAAGTATGADGVDTFTGIEGVTGSAFADVLRGDDSANGLAGGLGADTLEGRGGADQLSGEAGADSLDGGAGDDTLSGGQGDDVLSGGLGADRLDGGAGIDRAVFSGSTAVTVDLNPTTAQDTGHGLDTLISVEHVSGGTAGDRLTGDTAGNWLAGGGGDDTLSGGGGDDLIQVGSGANVLAGDAGVDTLSFRDVAGGVSVSLANQGTGIDTLQGVMTFNDFENLSGSAQGDTLTAAAGGGLLAGDLGADSLVGSAGADVLSGDGYVGVAGGSGAIGLVEGAQGGADTIDAGSGNDTVSGGAGNDLVLLNTQAGETARVSLGAGVDVLRLDAAMRGALVVTDFQGGPAGDQLDMADMLAARLTGWDSAMENPFETGHLRLVQDGAATVIEFDADGGGDNWSTLMRLENTSSLQLSDYNLGFMPLPMIVGGAGGDEFAWDPDSPADTVDGGEGVDIVNVTTPAVLVGTPTIKPSADGSALELDVDGDGVKDLTITGVEDLYINGEKVTISGDLSLTGLAPNTIHYVGTAAANLFDASGMISAESVDVQGLDGADTLIGGLADDLLQGGDGDDTLAGGADNDTLEGGAGADTLDGGAGTADVARFAGDSTDYVVSDLGGGTLQVSGPDGVDRLTGIEVLAFANGTFRQNAAPSGANASRTIVAGVALTLTANDFGFSDSQGDGLHAVKIASLPTTGELFLDLAPVTAGQVISADDIDAGRLVFLPNDTGTTATFTFQVRDDGVVGWGANEDATPNTLTFAVAGGGGSGGGSGDSGGSSVITSGTSGTAAADTVSLGSSADHFAAGDGGDSVSSGAGDDWVHGNAGADSLSGGAGADTLLGGRDNDRVLGDEGNDQLFGDAGDDTVMGGAGDDRVEGGEGANYLRGEDGNDLVVGGSGFDNAHGNVGNDTVRGGGGDDWVLGGKDEDQVFGDAGNDILNGNLGADTCSGGDGADIVRGGQADDLLDGGAGNDWLSGDLGDDTLTGGAGADVFNFFAGGGEDRVLDFSFVEGDRVQLARGETYTASQAGVDTIVELSGGERLILANVQLSGLSDGWIVAG